MKKLFVLFGVLFLMNSCSFYKEVEVVEIRDLVIQEFSEEVVEIYVELKIDNPNGYKVKLVDSDIHLKLNKSDLGRLRLGETLVLPKKSTSIQTLKVIADYDKIQEAISNNAFEILLSQSVFIKVDGFIKGKALGIGKKVAIEYNEKLTLDDLNLQL